TVILNELANYENECGTILEEIAYNPNTSLATLEELATNEEICCNVRQYAIFHDKFVSIPLLEKLATHQDWEIRRAVAANPNIPETLFHKLANDEVEEVRSHALAIRSRNS
ncbi:MAG: HEAT repeat domain-containing protein, partial [Rivularia sp. ALOHA_DT_140]|nr:HEAT repeat domain-containing protein [Rivularia sp. ALOHA_DT_140]